jgi:hypothetical protein
VGADAAEGPRRVTSDIDAVSLYFIGSGVPQCKMAVRDVVERTRGITSDIDSVSL